MKTLFLIGGSGFIGKHLTRILSAEYRITIFDRTIDYPFFDSFASVRTIQMDLVEDEINSDIETPDYIINLASVVTAERELSLFDSLISSNLKILLNLYRRFQKDDRLKLFMQFGSSEEYGSDFVPFGEENRECPNSPYALVKQLTTNTSIMLWRNYRFPIAVVRPGNLFGPFQHPSKFIPYVVDCLKKNLPLRVSPCEQKRDFIYVDDFARYIDLLLKNGASCLGEIINVSSGESVSLKEIIEFSRQELQSTSVVHYGAIPYRENETMDLRCSVEKLQKIICSPQRMQNIWLRMEELLKQ